MSRNECIAVLMPVYNAEKFLKEAIDSVLQQTYKNLSLVLVNDGSSDSSENIILSYSDPRIVYLKNEKNSGIVAALNKGLENIQCEYIARMDADDIAAPDRLQKQKDFMDKNPSVGVCGCFYKMFGTRNEVVKLYQNSEEIKAYLVFGSQLCHPGVMMRTALLKEKQLSYRAAHPHMEDYDLWYRMKDLTEFANIPEVLLEYRVSGENVTLRNAATKLERKMKFYAELLSTMGITATDKQLLLHVSMVYPQLVNAEFESRDYKDWLKTLINANDRARIFPAAAFKRELQKKWDHLFYAMHEKGNSSLLSYAFAAGGLSSAQVLYLMKFSFNKIFRPGKHMLKTN
jgi:glycosyltransferase involved in cell wall biosynthesis